MPEKEETELTEPMPFKSQEKTLHTPSPIPGLLKTHTRSCSKMPDSDSEWLNSTKPTASPEPKSKLQDKMLTNLSNTAEN